jgi:hypothetical protein
MLLVSLAVVPQSISAPVDIPASATEIKPAGANYHFPSGESYVYTVEWRLINAGIATLQMDSTGKEHRVKVTGNSTGVVNMLYTVRDRLESSFDSRTFCSTLYTKHTEEAFRKRDEQVRFDYARKKAVKDAKDLRNNQTQHVENDIPGCVTDVISGFYYLSSLPLETNASYRFPLSDGAPTVEVEAHVEGKEQIKTKAGTFPAIRVVAVATSGSLKDRGRLWIWYSDDAARIPVQMRAKLKWGNLSFNLQRIDRK